MEINYSIKDLVAAIFIFAMLIFALTDLFVNQENSINERIEIYTESFHHFLIENHQGAIPDDA